MKYFGLLLLLAGMLAACGGDPTAVPTATTLPPTDTPPTAVPTTAAATATVATAAEPATPTPDPTAAPTAEPTAEPDPVQVISGQTAEGAFFLGDPDAPLTVIDYSDFL